MNTPDVAVVILNWNSFQDTHECLKSLQKMNYRDLSVIVVDNLSSDNSFNRLKQEHQNNAYSGLRLTFIESGQNNGFADANNKAFEFVQKHISAKYIWMLNNDTVVAPDALVPLVQALDADQNLGGVSSKIYYYAKPNAVWFERGVVNRWTGRSKHVGRDTHWNSRIFREYISTASFLFRSSVLQVAGELNPNYFLYYEDTEWTIRIQLRTGLRLGTISQSKIWHKVNASTNSQANVPAPYIAYYRIRNSYYEVCDTEDQFHAWMAKQYRFINALRMMIAMFTRRYGNYSERWFYIHRAMFDSAKKKYGKHPEWRS